MTLQLFLTQIIQCSVWHKIVLYKKTEKQQGNKATFLKAVIDLGYFILKKSSLYVFYVFSRKITQLLSGKHRELETPKKIKYNIWSQVFQIVGGFIFCTLKKYLVEILGNYMLLHLGLHLHMCVYICGHTCVPIYFN